MICHAKTTSQSMINTGQNRKRTASAITALEIEHNRVLSLLILAESLTMSDENKVLGMIQTLNAPFFP